MVRAASELHTVAIKVFTNDLQNSGEINIFLHLASLKTDHPGRHYIRNALDSFTLHGPKGEHDCLVHELLWESMRELLMRNNVRRFTVAPLKVLLRRLFEALDFLHTKAHLIHTGNFLPVLLIATVYPSSSRYQCWQYSYGNCGQVNRYRIHQG